jgi:hypothetical protein
MGFKVLITDNALNDLREIRLSLDLSLATA